MNSLNKLVNQFPELGELLAEFENRIACLENSQPTRVDEGGHPNWEEIANTTPDEPTNQEILDKLHRVEVLKNDLENRLNNHIDASKKKFNTPF